MILTIATGTVEPIVFEARTREGELITGLTDLYIAIQRRSDGKWYDFNDRIFKVAGSCISRTQVLTEVGATYSTGQYAWSWDTSLAAAEAGWVDDDIYAINVLQINGGTPVWGLPACLGELRVGHEVDEVVRSRKQLCNDQILSSGSEGNLKILDDDGDPDNPWRTFDATDKNGSAISLATGFVARITRRS